jgi:hypothetical protein
LPDHQIELLAVQRRSLAAHSLRMDSKRCGRTWLELTPTQALQVAAMLRWLPPPWSPGERRREL